MVPSAVNENTGSTAQPVRNMLPGSPLVRYAESVTRTRTRAPSFINSGTIGSVRFNSNSPEPAALYRSVKLA
jgi:hypothetical protein